MERDPELTWLRERVMNVVGHELRTPASTIRGLSDALAGTTDPSRTAELVGALQRQAHRLEQLVDEVLTAAGVMTALPVGAPSAVAVEGVVGEAWTAVGGEPGRLVLHVAGVKVAARPPSVRGIFDAVLRNAVNLGDGSATVDSCRDDGMIAVGVDSPGPPLPDEDIRFAVEPFWRGERAVTSTPGLGLGLAVARALAEHEGGTLTVEALAGGGLRTTIGLPAA